MAIGSYCLPRNSGGPPLAETVKRTPSALHRIRLPSGDHDGMNPQRWLAKTIGFSPDPTRTFASPEAVSTAIHLPSGDQGPANSPSGAGAPPLTGEIQAARRPDSRSVVTYAMRVPSGEKEGAINRIAFTGK